MGVADFFTAYGQNPQLGQKLRALGEQIFNMRMAKEEMGLKKEAFKMQKEQFEFEKEVSFEKIVRPMLQEVANATQEKQVIPEYMLETYGLPKTMPVPGGKPTVETQGMQRGMTTPTPEEPFAIYPMPPGAEGGIILTPAMVEMYKQKYPNNAAIGTETLGSPDAWFKQNAMLFTDPEEYARFLESSEENARKIREAGKSVDSPNEFAYKHFRELTSDVRRYFEVNPGLLKGLSQGKYEETFGDAVRVSAAMMAWNGLMNPGSVGGDGVAYARDIMRFTNQWRLVKLTKEDLEAAVGEAEVAKNPKTADWLITAWNEGM